MRRTSACLLPANGEQGSQGGSRMGARHRRGRAGKRKVGLRRLLVAGGRRVGGRDARGVEEAARFVRACGLSVREGRTTEGISA